VGMGGRGRKSDVRSARSASFSFASGDLSLDLIDPDLVSLPDGSQTSVKRVSMQPDPLERSPSIGWSTHRVSLAIIGSSSSSPLMKDSISVDLLEILRIQLVESIERHVLEVGGARRASR
jgi:hypothetical protein